MTNTYDTSNFLPCPFCGAAPEAIDWPGGPMAKVFIHCPNDNYDSEDGGCSAGPDVVGSDIEQAAARWNRRAQVPEVSDHNVRLISQSMAFLASAIKSGEAWSEQCQHIYDRAQNTLSEIASPQPATTEVPDEAFNLIEGIRAELTWPGWRKTSSRDWVMDSLSELLSMLTASPAPGKSAKSHNWNDVGERCLDCGDKDWFAGTVCEGRQEEAER